MLVKPGSRVMTPMVVSSLEISMAGAPSAAGMIVNSERVAVVLDQGARPVGGVRLDGPGSLQQLGVLVGGGDIRIGGRDGRCLGGIGDLGHAVRLSLLS